MPYGLKIIVIFDSNPSCPIVVEIRVSTHIFSILAKIFSNYSLMVLANIPWFQKIATGMKIKNFNILFKIKIYTVSEKNPTKNVIVCHRRLNLTNFVYPETSVVSLSAFPLYTRGSHLWDQLLPLQFRQPVFIQN